LTLFYFNGMQTHAKTSEERESSVNHKHRFSSARDARNRKVRGLWKCRLGKSATD
jgi:hypothetical protein